MTTRMAEVEQRYSIGALMNLTGLSRSTICRAIADGRRSGGRLGICPAEIVGGRTLIPASSAEAWLRRGRMS